MTDAPSYRDVIAHELRGVAMPQMARALAQDIEHALIDAGYCIERGWQSMDTAPRDGSAILVCLHGDDQMVVFYDAAPADAPGHVWHRIDGLSYHSSAITHWRPLAARPR